MTAPVTSRERVPRGARSLSGLLRRQRRPDRWRHRADLLAWGCAILAAGPVARVGLDADWSVGFLAARLYVG
jgi:hypothetical protein